MSEDINALHSKRSKNLRKAWEAYNRSGSSPEPSGNRNHRPVSYRKPVTFEEYVSMKKERSRRNKISETLSTKSDLKAVGLTPERIEAYLKLLKSRVREC